MQKRRSITFLKQVVEQLDNQQETNIAKNVSFRQKDFVMLKQECQEKFTKLTSIMSQKQNLEGKLIGLKQILCQLNPEALQEIERDCQKKAQHECDQNQERQGNNELAKSDFSKPIKKRSDKKKRKKERLFYD